MKVKTTTTTLRRLLFCPVFLLFFSPAVAAAATAAAAAAKAGGSATTGGTSIILTGYFSFDYNDNALAATQQEATAFQNEGYKGWGEGALVNSSAAPGLTPLQHYLKNGTGSTRDNLYVASADGIAFAKSNGASCLCL